MSTGEIVLKRHFKCATIHPKWKEQVSIAVMLQYQRRMNVLMVIVLYSCSVTKHRQNKTFPAHFKYSIMIPVRQQHLQHKHSFHIRRTFGPWLLQKGCLLLVPLQWLTDRKNWNSKQKVKGFWTKSIHQTYCNSFPSAAQQHIRQVAKYPTHPKHRVSCCSCLQHVYSTHTPSLKRHHATSLRNKCCFAFTQHMKSSFKIREFSKDACVHV